MRRRDTLCIICCLDDHHAYPSTSCSIWSRFRNRRLQHLRPKLAAWYDGGIPDSPMECKKSLRWSFPVERSIRRNATCNMQHATCNMQNANASVFSWRHKLMQIRFPPCWCPCEVWNCKQLWENLCAQDQSLQIIHLSNGYFPRKRPRITRWDTSAFILR